MSKRVKGETCATAIRAVFEPSETVTFTDLVRRVKGKGRWTNSTIWEHLMSLVVNLPPARLHWPKVKPFLFLHPDGRYELCQDTGCESFQDAGTNTNGGLTPAQVIELHLKLDIILDKIDSKKIPNEGISSRVTRLRDTNILPRNIACMMLTVNSLRNMVVHERFVMGLHEAAVVRSAMAAIEAWSKEKKKPNRRLATSVKTIR